MNNGTATLAGTLRAELANGYLPTPGNTYTVMTFTARSGLFTIFSFPDYDFGVVQTATNVILIASNALPALSFSAPTSQLVCVPFQLTARTSDLDGTVTNLQLLLNASILANYTNPPSGTLLKLPVTYDFPGPVTFTARSTDDKGGVKETNILCDFVTLPLHELNLGGVVSNSTFKFCMLGEAGSNYMVLATTNIALAQSNWTALGLMESTNGIWRYFDSGAVTNRRHRLYRAQQMP